ncbi:MAG: energy transducer TonB [Bacteroidota bacterium]
MEPNKILSAELIDVIFDGRNKDYGAYELRKTYSTRTKLALSFTICVVALALTGVTLANSFKKNQRLYDLKEVVELKSVADEKPPEKLPEPEKQPEPPQAQVQKFTTLKITPDDLVTDPPPDQRELDSSVIGSKDQVGIPDDGIEKPTELIGQDKGIIEDKPLKDPDHIVEIVDIPAKFSGNWKNFLERNLNPEVPVDNGAPAGRYSVVMQFVVDKEGAVSEIKALTDHGYGLEQEAIRVLKKAPKWQPAILAGYTVKAYHRQVIVFEVLGE